VSYRLSPAAVTQLAMDRLEAVDPAAEQVVRVCTFRAPKPVAAERFTNAARHLPEPPGTVSADPLSRGQALARIGGQALARIDAQVLREHRLTRAIIRTRLSSGQGAASRAQAAALRLAIVPRRPGTAVDLARVGAAAAPPAGPGPRYQQPSPQRPYPRRGPVPDLLRHRPQRPRAGSAAVPAPPRPERTRPLQRPQDCQGPDHRPSGDEAVCRSAGAGRRHPGPVPPGAGRRPPRHPYLRQQPRR
jgi:hypothetical protein